MGMEALSMEMNHPDNTVSFSKKKGCYVNSCVAFMFFVLFISGIVATGLLVYYYLPEVKDTVDNVKGFFQSLSNSDEEGTTKQTPMSTTMRMITEKPPTLLKSIPLTPIQYEINEETNHNSFDVEIAVHPTGKVNINQPSTSLSSTTSSPPASPSTYEKKWSMRLPRAVKPVHYLVKLQPFINGNFSIHGYVEIEMEVLENTHNITMHIADIITHNGTITLNRMTQENQLVPLAIKKHEYDPKREFYIAHFDQPLEKGSHYILKMSFTGYLNDKLKGFYRSTYTDDDGSQKLLATTQFQASDARRAFPCFDEPGLKATFEIYLAREEAMTSISNMPMVETMPMPEQNGWVWDRYNTTVPMSTYLIAFVVSDFDSMNITNEDWMFRVWARKSALQQAEYALDIGQKMLRHFEEFFQISFPLPKLDMIAIPDFPYGAMENWGLVTFRETLMLYHPLTSFASNKQQIAAVTGHELAHQWFGNLVTPKWWNDIWLNEGFASYVEYLGVDHVEPSFKIMEQFVFTRIHDVMQMDSLESSHPIRHDAINGDKITYSKGCSIIRMMNHFLTLATFTKGLNNYLRAFQYANAEQDDLWHYLTLAAHEDEILPQDLSVKTIMDTWTLQMGYPVIQVTRSSDGTAATVSQGRFLLKKKANSTDNHDYKWWVPLTFASQRSPDFQKTKPMTWMDPSQSEISIVNLPPNDQWLVINVQQTGFYRVNYDNNNWKLISSQLMKNHSVIHTINRAQILDDAMNFAKAGQLPYHIPLLLYKYLAAEDQYVPWVASLSNLAYIRRMFLATPGYGALKKYLLSIVAPLYESVGFEDRTEDPALSQYKRAKGLAWACLLEDPDCLEKSVALYRLWMNSPTNNSIISPNLKSMVYCRAIQEGGEEEWNFAWHQYHQSNVGSEKENLLSAMGCTRELWILSRYLDMAFTSDSGIRKQDSRRVFTTVANNPVGTYLAWNFLREHFDRIYSFYDKIIINLLRSSTEGFNMEEQLKEARLLTEAHASQLSEQELEVQQLLENVENNLSWMNNYYDVIVQWLEFNGYSNSQDIFGNR